MKARPAMPDRYTVTGTLRVFYRHPGLDHALVQGKLPGRASKGWRRHRRRAKAAERAR